MFTILKDVAGVWWHLYNNNATKVHLSDFDVIIEAVAETFVIEPRNGSNIPSQAISISDIRVIDESISTTIPIAFSGATGLIELLTSLGYPPYLSNAPSQPPVKVYTKGQTAFFTNITQTWIDANFDNTGLGINEAIGWEKVPELDGKVPIGQTTGGLFDNIGNSYGFANTVLVAHEHDSIEYSDGKKGVNTVGKGATVAGRAIAESSATDKTNKTSKVGQDHTGAPSTVETGANKNYQPSLIVLYVRRTTDLWIMGGSGTAQNLAQTLAIDNKTNNIPITSNNGKAVVDVNDNYISLYYGAQTFAMTDTGVQLYSEVPVSFDSNVSTDFNTPVLNYNSSEVATQGWVASQGYGTVTSVSGTTDEITVSSPTTTPVVGISSNYTSARDAYADAKVADNLTASTTVAPSKTAVNNALDLKIDETTWVDYSATSTIVGWSSFTAKKINYKILDNLMIVDFNLEGTSNLGTASFTIPSNSAVFSFILSAYIVNNGNASNNPGRISTVSGSNVVTIQRDGQNNAFFAFGTKRCSGQIIIQL